MAKGSNQKLKIVYLIKILTEKTDEQHSITMNEIISELKAYGVNAERKSLYNDIENLRQYGLDIVGEQHDRTYYYYLVSRLRVWQANIRHHSFSIRFMYLSA